MKLSELKGRVPRQTLDALSKAGIEEMRPSQEKAIHAGLFDGKNLLVCTPTASGKTMIAELAMTKTILEGKGKAIYIAPLKALASEKFREFKQKYEEHMNIALAVGDMDSLDTHLSNYDLILCTSEKLDSLIRHHSPWVNEVSVVVVDEIHLLNDGSRGPTLEILITMLRQREGVQLIGLSATIGNEKELAEWLDANLVHDTWRPVELHKGTYINGEIEFEKNIKK